MDTSIVYIKTAKGSAEVATRSGTLGPAARRVLIVIDGRKPLSELAAVVRPGEIEQVIKELLTLGLIEPAQARDANAAPAAAAAAPAAAPSAALPPMAAPPSPATPEDPALQYARLQDAKRRVIQELQQRLGSDADVITLRVERSKTAEEFQERVREAERLISGLQGQSAAQEFARLLRKKP